MESVKPANTGLVDALIHRYCKVLEAVIAVFLLVMVVLVFGNVVLRYGFNLGITVSEEISRWLFVWMTFLGAIVAMRGAGISCMSLSQCAIVRSMADGNAWMTRSSRDAKCDRSRHG